MKKVLHVVGGLNRGGIETWLVSCLSHAQTEDLEMYFLTYGQEEFAYENDVVALGGHIIRISEPKNIFTYLKELWKLLKNNSFDIVHSHTHFNSGIPILFAKVLKIRTVCHCHSAFSWKDSSSIFSKVYALFMVLLSRTFSDVKVAVSQKARISFFGKSSNVHVVPCGINLDNVRKTKVNRKGLNASLGIHDDDFVVAHIGRIEVEKNHNFIIDVFDIIQKQKENAVLVLVGVGSLQEELEKKIALLGLKEKVIFTGSIDYVYQLLASRVDSFLFPSLFEGLPLTLLEVQAFGIPCVISNTIDARAQVNNTLCTVLTLDDSAEVWAQTVLSNSLQGIQTGAVEVIEQAGYDVLSNLKLIVKEY